MPLHSSTNPIAKIAALAVVAATLAVATVAACTPAPTPTIAPTWTPVPTWTPEPTYTPIPIPNTTPVIVQRVATATPTVKPTSTQTPTTTSTPSATSTPTPTPIPADAPQDLRPLIALYNATNGPEWGNNDNWLSDRPLYDWFGVKVNTDGRITGIHLGANKLTGILPPELGDLAQLEILDLSNASISGSIPREFGQLTELRELILEHNDLTGPIPHEIGHLPHLRHLNLAYNNLSGEFPPSIMASETLEDIDLRDNALIGSIPKDISQQSQIRFLYLGGNLLSATVPSEIERSRYLIHLSLSDNRLTGTIPGSISRLQALSRLDLDNNRLTGDIPKELGDLELHQLQVAGNEFSGCVPTNLRNVRFNDVEFANIPVCGMPARPDPVVPSYIKLQITDSANPTQTFAVMLGMQWLNDFTELMGWPTPENTITVFVDRWDGLVTSFSDYVEGCDLGCASYNLERRSPDPRYIKGAAFVQIRGPHGNALQELAEEVAQETFSAMQLELADGLSTQGLRRDPRWWTYGLSTFVGEIAVADGIGESRDVARQDTIDWIAGGQFDPLWEHEERGNWGNPQLQRALAIDLLASQVGLRKLTEFYTERINGEDWRKTFERVFNISVPDFYELYNQYHRDGYPLRPIPTEGSTEWR